MFDDTPSTLSYIILLFSSDPNILSVSDIKPMLHALNTTDTCS